MAPDKIYIPENISKSDLHCMLSLDSKGRGIEYIRKDALLDKLNLALKRRGKGNPNSDDDGIQTIKAMINYIESL